MTKRGYASVPLSFSLPPSVVNEASFVKSNHSLRFASHTLHHQRGVVTVLEGQSVPTQLNRSQFREIYSMKPVRNAHSQTLHAHNSRILFFQSPQTSVRSSLVITPSKRKHSSTPTNSQGSCSRQYAPSPVTARHESSNRCTA